jgi:aspartate-semialdehyde dehydrogenase
MAELQDGILAGAKGEPIQNEVFAHPLPYNVIPHIDVFQDNLYTKEEMKVAWETKKIFREPGLPVSCTAVRIPTLRAHSEAIVVETDKPVSRDAALAVLGAAPGVKVVDDPANNLYPMPLTATECYDVEVGRVRNNIIFGEHGLEFFVSGDQLLKGAALNAVQIAEAVIA